MSPDFIQCDISKSTPRFLPGLSVHSFADLSNLIALALVKRSRRHLVLHVGDGHVTKGTARLINLAGRGALIVIRYNEKSGVQAALGVAQLAIWRNVNKTRLFIKRHDRHSAHARVTDQGSGGGISKRVKITVHTQTLNRLSSSSSN